MESLKSAVYKNRKVSMAILFAFVFIVNRYYINEFHYIPSLIFSLLGTSAVYNVTSIIRVALIFAMSRLLFKVSVSIKKSYASETLSINILITMLLSALIEVLRGSRVVITSVSIILSTMLLIFLERRNIDSRKHIIIGIKYTVFRLISISIAYGLTLFIVLMLLSETGI